MTNMPLSSLWSVLFFTMMLTLGFGSQFSILETTLSGIQDEFRRLGVHLTERRKIAFRYVFKLNKKLSASSVFMFVGSYFNSEPTQTRGPLKVRMYWTVIAFYHWAAHQSA